MVLFVGGAIVGAIWVVADERPDSFGAFVLFFLMGAIFGGIGGVVVYGALFYALPLLIPIGLVYGLYRLIGFSATAFSSVRERLSRADSVDEERAAVGVEPKHSTPSMSMMDDAVSSIHPHQNDPPTSDPDKLTSFPELPMRSREMPALAEPGPSAGTLTILDPTPAALPSAADADRRIRREQAVPQARDEAACCQERLVCLSAQRQPHDRGAPPRSSDREVR